MIAIKNFLRQAKERFSDESYHLIKEALRKIIACNQNKTRYDESMFYNHAIGVASIVMQELEMGANSVLSSLLHDIVRQEALTLEDVANTFNPQCVEILEGMNNISSVETKPNSNQVEHFKELIVSYSTNPRIILIKLADRLEVMRSLEMFPIEKQAKKAWETLHIYAQLAHKLGLYKIKSEMEDLALRHLEPKAYSEIKTKLESTASARENFIEQFVSPIKKRLEQDQIDFTIKGRTKSVYSIWRKMKAQNISFEEVYDVFAIRIVLSCPAEQEKSRCWHAYSVVTDFYNPNPNRMRDWISIPKSNGYESLHATVVTTTGKWVEVQIRSSRMDEIAERGIAAHWRYKGVESGKIGSEEWLSRLRDMMEDLELNKNGLTFNTPIQPSNKEVFAFTPNGDLRKLPEGATVLDFAYDIHTKLGERCVGAKINHRNVSIKELLHNGDLVEISTSKTQKPKTDWLNIAITSKARSRIKAFLREEVAKRANLGREELERKIKNWKLNIGIEEAVNTLLKYYKLRSGLDFYGLITEEKIAMSDIKELLIKHLSGENITRVTEERGEKKESKSVAKEDCMIIDENLRDVEYKLAKCCNPIYGDEIYAFVTVLKGITIHRKDCVNGARLIERFPYRVLQAQWNNERASGSMFSARIAIESEETMGLEHSIRDAIRDLRINIRSLSFEYNNKIITGVVTVEVNSIGMLESVIYKLLKIKGMNKAYRIKGV